MLDAEMAPVGRDQLLGALPGLMIHVSSESKMSVTPQSAFLAGEGC